MKYTLIEINLNESTVEKLLSDHSEAGYIIITAFKGGSDNPQQLKTNYLNNNKLKQDIKSAGFGYFPVWGGYIEKDEKTGQFKEVKEQSFVVSSFKYGGELGSIEQLKSLGLQWCRKYEQESYLYKPRGMENQAQFINADGTEQPPFKSVSPATSADAYFTSLNRSRMKDIRKKSFVYREGIVYFAQSANSLNEAYMRYGEFLFRFNNKG